MRLIEDGLGDCQVKPIMTKKDGSPIDHDSDPVIIEVHYPAKVDSNSYVHPVVKIEISCLSMKEPCEVGPFFSMKSISEIILAQTA